MQRKHKRKTKTKYGRVLHKLDRDLPFTRTNRDILADMNKMTSLTEDAKSSAAIRAYMRTFLLKESNKAPSGKTLRSFPAHLCNLINVRTKLPSTQSSTILKKKLQNNSPKNENP